MAAAEGLRDCPLTGIAATPPYYYSNTQDELIDHFRAIADRCAQPLWVYNIPSTVKVTVEPDTIAALAADGTVAGVKDSSGGGETFAQLVMLCRKRGLALHRFVGSVWRATMAGFGAHGIIPGIANLAPRSLSAAWEAGQRDDQETAGRCLDQVLAATRVTRIQAGGSAGSGFSGLKCALKLMGIIEHDTVSAPFQGLDEAEKEQIPALLEETGLAAELVHGPP
jgi:4-hydroxy-tetrahydrodipicolinate synthase